MQKVKGPAGNGGTFLFQVREQPAACLFCFMLKSEIMATKDHNNKSNMSAHPQHEGQPKKQTGNRGNADGQNMDELEREAEKERSRKPGQSQGGDGKRHNNGRGGGK